MKIQIIQDHLRSGGTERQGILLAHAFQNSGHEVQVVTFRPGGALAATLAPVPQVVLQPFDTRLDWFAPGLRRAVRSFSPKIVLCMGRMANSWSGSLQRHLQRTGSTAAVVATMRTGKALPKLFQTSLRSVRQIVANSEDARQLLVTRYGIAQEKIAVIHNALVFPDVALDWENKSARRKSLRQTQGADDSTFIMLCVGMFRPEKNQRALIDIVAKLPTDLNWQLWLVGEGSALAEVKALANERGCADRVKFFGFQANPSSFYDAADLAVLTSKSESLSNFLIEAHAHALPSVAYDVMGVKECGGRAVALGDEKSFLSEILELSGDSALRKTEGEKMSTFARRAFGPEKQASEYLKLFERLG